MAGVGRGRAPPGNAGESKEDNASDGEGGGSDMVAYLEEPPSEKERRLLTRRMFPSKVGGRPAWLVPQGLPSPATAVAAAAAQGEAAAVTSGAAGELGCRRCGRPLRFLLQVYASRGEEKKGAFHRVLHLFVCTSCQPNEAKVFRAQLPRANTFYGSDPPNPGEIAKKLKKAGDRDADLDLVCCRHCGLPREAPDSSGKEAALCADCARRERNGDGPALFEERELSTTEAEVPDEEEEEEEVPGTAASRVPGGAAAAEADEGVEEVFTPGAVRAKGHGRDLVAEAESVLEAAKSKGASAAVLQKLEEYRAKVAESAENAIDATEQAVFDEYSREQGEHDPVFSKFNRYAAANNGHVLRYAFGGRPIWFCGPGQPEGTPKCQNCGAPRVFEFQVQPQLIALLCGTTAMAERLEFGVICCFSCSQSCDAAGERPYLEEYAFVQPEPGEAWLPRA